MEEEKLTESNLKRGIFLSSDKTNFTLQIQEEIEIHLETLNGNEIVKIKDVVLYAPKFKHRDFYGKIKDIINKQVGIQEGLTDFDDNCLSNLAKAFYEFFQGTDDILKIKYKGSEYILKDKTFIDNVPMKDIEKITSGYMDNFFS